MYFRRNFLRIRKKKKVKHIPLDNVFYGNNVFLFNSLETTSSDYRRLNFILLFITLFILLYVSTNLNYLLSLTLNFDVNNLLNLIFSSEKDLINFHFDFTKNNINNFDSYNNLLRILKC